MKIPNSPISKKEITFKIFSLDNDEVCNNLGKVIGTEYSRKFLQICGKKELNLKEIAKLIEKTDNPRLPNPTHHKNRLKKLGLIFSSFLFQRKKGHQLNFYKGLNVMIVVSDDTLANRGEHSEELKNTINKVFKLGSIGLITLASYFTSHQLFNPQSVFMSTEKLTTLDISALAVSVILLSSLLIFDRFYTYKYNRGSIPVKRSYLKKKIIN